MALIVVVVDGDGFFLLGLVTVSSEPLVIGGVCTVMAELQVDLTLLQCYLLLN